MFQYCLFDLDGTLTDSQEGIIKSVQYALKAFGIYEDDLEKLALFLGPPLKRSFIEHYGLTEKEAEKAIEIYRERFAPIGIFENSVYAGIPDMLEKLKAEGMHLAVASSKPECYVRQILEHFDIDKYFDVTVGSELDGSRSKKEEVVEEALKRLGVLTVPVENRQRVCAMVGDRKFDLQGAKTHFLTGIGVSYGYAPKGELEEEGADYIAGTVDELAQYLEGHGLK